VAEREAGASGPREPLSSRGRRPLPDLDPVLDGQHAGDSPSIESGPVAVHVVVDAPPVDDHVDGVFPERLETERQIADETAPEGGLEDLPAERDRLPGHLERDQVERAVERRAEDCGVDLLREARVV
jgi:hypothetical protein